MEDRSDFTKRMGPFWRSLGHSPYLNRKVAGSIDQKWEAKTHRRLIWRVCVGVGNAAEMNAEPITNTGLAKVPRRLHVAIAPIRS